MTGNVLGKSQRAGRWFVILEVSRGAGFPPLCAAFPCQVPLCREEWGLCGKMGHSEVEIITHVLPRDLQNLHQATFSVGLQATGHSGPGWWDFSTLTPAMLFLGDTHHPSQDGTGIHPLALGASTRQAAWNE